MDAQRISEIARELKPVYEASESCFRTLLDAEQDVVALNAAWEASLGAYNTLLRSYCGEIAQCTGNHVDNVKMLLLPRGDDIAIMWTPQELMNVANYMSFNSKLWSAHSGFWREPTNSFTF